MKLDFVKYQGTGNDFIMLNNLNGQYDDLTIEGIVFLCDRKLGVGADGLIKISSVEGHDFEVEYFNSDGSQSFCGNGARCSVAFARSIGINKGEVSFVAIDGVHKARVIEGTVEVEMLPVRHIERVGDDYFLDTGSPHYITVLTNEKDVDIISYGQEVRYSDRYEKDGVNVNSMKVVGPSKIYVETYERGVEDETLSCGTGVTACALLLKYLDNDQPEKIEIETKGGTLYVKSDPYVGDVGYQNIWLGGPATRVYEGSIDV